MFDFIRKPLLWKAWDESLDRQIQHPSSFRLKSVQDLAVYSELRGIADKDIAEIGAGHSRVLPALAGSNRCVSIEKFEGEGGGPREVVTPAGVSNVPAYVGQNDPLLKTGSFDILFSISVVEHVAGLDDLAAFHEDQIRILRSGGFFLHAIDLYLEDEPSDHHRGRFEAYRRWVTETPGVEPLGDVFDGPCKFTCDLATNPDNVMHAWGRVSPRLIAFRQRAQSTSVLVGGRKVSST